MNYEQILPLLTEVAIAITGFSGLVSVLGHKNVQNWSEVDSIRLNSLLTASLSAFIFCLISFALLSASIAEETVWRLVSGLVAVERSIWIIRFFKRISDYKASGQTLFFFYLFSAGNACVALLGITNFLLLGLLWPFVTCIVWYLIESSFVFVRSILFRVQNLRNA